MINQFESKDRAWIVYDLDIGTMDRSETGRYYSVLLVHPTTV
jgi:hypothetical protein